MRTAQFSRHVWTASRHTQSRSSSAIDTPRILHPRTCAHNFPKRLRTFALFLYTTGGRSGEAKKLEWSQVEWKSRLVRVIGEQTKNEQPRTIPLADEVFNRLSDVPEQQASAGSFPSDVSVKRGRGTRDSGKEQDQRRVWNLLRSAGP